MHPNRYPAFLKATLLTLAIMAAPAHAAWTLTNDNGGDGHVTGAFPVFTLIGADNGVGANTTFYTQTFTADTVVDFSWTYTTLDCCGSVYDPAGYVLNGVQTQLTQDLSGAQGTGNASGSNSVAVAAGDSFGWYIYSTDTIAGAATFSVPAANPIPEPASFGLLLCGLGGLWTVRKKKGFTQPRGTLHEG